MSHRSELVRQLVERGFLHQATDLDSLDSLAAERRITAYIGFDCTADSLHVGNLVSIMLLRLVQRTGHRPIALVGGGTTKVGDPSGKDEARRLLDKATLATYIAGVRRSLKAFLRFGNRASDALLVNNDAWLSKLRYIDFLQEYGRHFTINRMLDFDSVRLRLEREKPLTFLEFNYMVLQAYDFLELARRYDCRLQMGGSDQWGNIVNGVDLARRVDRRKLFGVTTPLITTSTGAKMGKTAEGAVWLNRNRLPAFNYWQHWRNTDDADVGRFLRLFTELPLNEVARLEALQGAELNEAKVVLADEATRLCRGEAEAKKAAAAARHVFLTPETGKLAVGGDPPEVTTGLPTTDLPRAELEHGINVADLLNRTGLAASKGEARRLIRGGGARLNDARVDDEALMVDTAHLEGDQLTLSAGRKRHVRVRAV